MVEKFKLFTLTLRALMELGVVVALFFGGYHIGGTTSMKIVFALAAPIIGFGFWGVVDFHQAGKLGEPLRMIQELTISLLAALAWYVAGYHSFGWGLAALTIVYHILMPLSGQKLLKDKSRVISNPDSVS